MSLQRGGYFEVPFKVNYISPNEEEMEDISEKRNSVTKFREFWQCQVVRYEYFRKMRNTSKNETRKAYLGAGYQGLNLPF